MSLDQSILAVVSGGIVGLSLGLLGGGGSILAVPLLLYVVGLKNPHIVIGTTALAVSVNAYLNLIPHWRAGHVNWKAGVGFSLPGIGGAVAGSFLGRQLHGSTLLFLFAILMLIIAGLVLKTARPARDGKVRPTRHDGQGAVTGATDALALHWPKVGGSGFLVGALSGFFGIGGGFLIVPALVFSADLAFITAIGTSLVAVGTFGLTTAITYALHGMINLPAFAAYVVGGALAGIIGTRMATHLSQQRAALNYLFAAVLVAVALYMLYKNAVMLHL